MTIYSIVETISKNKIKILQSFRQKKVRKKEKKFLVEGKKCVVEALDSDFEITDILYLQGAGSEFSGIIEEAKKKSINIYKGTEKNLRDCSDAVTSQGIIALVKIKKFDFNTLLKKDTSVMLLLDSVSDPGNAGALIRTASWFNLQALILSRNSAELYSPKVVRSTMGALFHLPVFHDFDLIDTLKKLKNNGFNIFAADITGEDSRDFSHNKIALILGNESRGIHQELKKLSHGTIAVPGSSKCESLNVAASGSILLWEIYRTKHNIR